jgi:hypothetical protein
MSCASIRVVFELEEVLVTQGQKLPLYNLARVLRAPVLTAYSPDADAAICEQFGELNLMLWGADRRMKCDRLLRVARPGVFVSADRDTRLYMTKMTGWDARSPEETTVLFAPLGYRFR